MLCFLSDYDLKYLNLCWSESCLLVSAVKFNQNLKDLFLGDNKLTSPDGQSLGAMLKGNGYLQLLDLRNNPLQVRHTTCNKIVFFFLGSVIHAQHVLEFRFCFRMQFDRSWWTCAMSSELSCMTWEDVFFVLESSCFYLLTEVLSTLCKIDCYSGPSRWKGG